MADDLEDDQWLYGDSDDKIGDNEDNSQEEPAASDEQETPVAQLQPTVIFYESHNITSTRHVYR